MPTLKNLDVNPEVRGNVLEALVTLGEMKLPGKGVLRLRKIRRRIAEEWRDVEEARLEVLKEYVVLDEKGEIVWEQEGPTRRTAVWKGDTDEERAASRKAHQEIFNELMDEEFTIDLTLNPDHLGMKNLNAESPVTANLLFQLGDLFEEPEEK